MKYAIISDIHSNLEAFSLFCQQIPKLKIEKIVCLGDVVGYNANPKEVIKILSNLDSIELIRGNHDRAIGNNDFTYFSYNAVESGKWTIKQLNSKDLSFLKNLDAGPKQIDNSFGICHGSTLNEDNYIFSISEARDDFEWMKENNIGILFFGHTHQQKTYCMDEKGYISIIKENPIIIESKNFYLINPGSIGQPRDNDPRASFAVFDSNNMEINIIRYEYPIQITQKKIYKANLPEVLALRLEVGR